MNLEKAAERRGGLKKMKAGMDKISSKKNAHLK
jgi:hypothetical protein